MVPDRDRGFALVAAVAAVAAFAYVAFEVMATDRGVIAGVSARVEQAHLQTAADAGLAMAIHGLAQEDAAQRWAIDGRTRGVEFDGVDLQITIQDERGKAPLDGLNPAQARALFEGGGADGDRVDNLVNELRDAQANEDDSTVEPPPAPPDQITDGQPPQALAAAPVRKGGFRIVGDLMALKDMNADLYWRIAPAITVFFEESGPFEPTHAGPLAKTAMAAEEAQSPEELEAQRAEDNQTPQETIVDENLIGRTLTIQVLARDRNHAAAHRTVIMELTGTKAPGYWIRYVE